MRRGVFIIIIIIFIKCYCQENLSNLYCHKQSNLILLDDDITIDIGVGGVCVWLSLQWGLHHYPMQQNPNYTSDDANT